MSFQCPRLETVIIQCSKGGSENKTEKLVNAMVANGVSLEKIHVTFYEDIVKRNLPERMGVGQEEERNNLERRLKENEEWVDDSYALSDDNDDEMEDEYQYDDYF
ncbi:hypothetical protein ACP4OV_019876 [Aristida adscensionis]